MKLKLFVFAGLLLLSVAFVTAIAPHPTCGVIVASTTTQGFLSEISSINSVLQSCSVDVPSPVNSLFGNGNLLVEVSMNSGSVESFYVTIANNQVTGIISGTTTGSKYLIETDEDTMDNLLSSNNLGNDFLTAYNNKDIRITANGFFNKIKFFFLKFFIPKPSSSSGSQNTAPAATPTGKPEFCDETFLPGHRDYADNKELWDSYSAQTDKVCQSQFGRGIPSPCVYTIQLSIDGNPYYLCWYNE